MKGIILGIGIVMVVAVYLWAVEPQSNQVQNGRYQLHVTQPVSNGTTLVIASFHLVDTRTGRIWSFQDAEKGKMFVELAVQHLRE